MNKKCRLDLAIVTNESIPVGMAATNRILSYSKALAKSYKVKIYIPKPTEDIEKPLNLNIKGAIDNIEYEYVYGDTIWPYEKSKLKKIGIILNGYFKLIKCLFRDKPKTILLYSSSFTLRLLIIMLRQFICFRLIIEENEYPKILRSTNKFLIRIHLSVYKHADGMVVMTKELLDYYRKINVNNIFILPMTVDSTRFTNKSEIGFSFEYFIYVGGNGGFVRDGVLDIVKAYKYLTDGFPNIKLVIVGPIGKKGKVFVEIQNYLRKHNLENNVVFMGSKPSNEIPIFLQNALGVVMAPPKNFSSGGFPTKLGEFLASGTPVITTKVSDIPLFLNDSNSFTVDPQNVVGIYEAMKWIITNKERALAIGANGKALALSCFNVEKYLSDLVDFFNLKTR
ncbi:MAG: glycosyltransferase involved in cell wall biosynthesis [Desulforhopalus sp.]|jgi:glycosyltransferase involved in cell wall biosynthesis